MTVHRDPNAHVVEYLDYYLSLSESPHYAVLLNGPWGVGKTYLIRKVIDRAKAKKLRVCYVSLFGTTSTEDIDRAVFSALYPLLDNKATKAFGYGLRGALKFLRVDVDIDKTDFLSRFNADVFVFDDIERSHVQLNAVLGYINQFVEHDGLKVVVVANENEIPQTERDEYAKRREKVVGMTLLIAANVDEALPAFIEKVHPKEARDFLVKNVSTIRRIYAEFGAGNLRVLQQALWDFGRLFSAIKESHRSKNEGMTAVLELFMAIAMEFKFGRVDSDAISRRDRYFKYLSHQTEPKPGKEALEQTIKRYPGTDISDQVLTNEILISMLRDGRVDAESIEGAFLASRYFTPPAELPPWRVLWEKEVYPDDVAQAAFEKVEASFKAREYTVPGEILHVLGLRLTMAAEGILDSPAETIVAEGKAYVDDLLAAKKLTPLDRRESHFSKTAYEGLGYSSIETPHFKELAKYLSDQRAKAFKRDLPAEAKELLREMKEDPNLFWRRINYSNTADTKFADIPIFNHIEPNDFVARLLELRPYDQRLVLMGLATRYENARLSKDLSVELAWVQEVAKLLLTTADASGPMGKNRLRKFVRWTLHDPIQAAIAPVEPPPAEPAPIEEAVTIVASGEPTGEGN